MQEVLFLKKRGHQKEAGRKEEEDLVRYPEVAYFSGSTGLAGLYY